MQKLHDTLEAVVEKKEDDMREVRKARRTRSEGKARNASCGCGSGKKYKFCCLGKGDPC